MRKLYFLLLPLFVCFWAEAQTHVQFTLTDPQFGITQTTNRRVDVQAESGTSVSGANVLLPFKLSGTTGTNGVVTFSNLFGSAIAGYYHVTVPAPPQRAEFDIWVQSTNLGLIQASTIMGTFGASTYPAGVFAWGAQVSDARYSQSTTSLSGYVQIGQLISTSNSIVSLIPSTNGLATTNYVNNSVNSVSNSLLSLIGQSNSASYVSAGITNQWRNDATNTARSVAGSLTNLNANTSNSLYSTVGSQTTSLTNFVLLIAGQGTNFARNQIGLGNTNFTIAQSNLIWTALIAATNGIGGSSVTAGVSNQWKIDATNIARIFATSLTNLDANTSNSLWTSFLNATNGSLAAANAYTLVVAGYGTNNVLATAIRLTNDVMAASNNLAVAQIAGTNALWAAQTEATNVSLAAAKAYALSIGANDTNFARGVIGLAATNKANAIGLAATNNSLAISNATVLYVRAYTNQFPLTSLKTMPVTNSDTRFLLFYGDVSFGHDAFFGDSADYIRNDGTYSFGRNSVYGDTNGIFNAQGLNSFGNVTFAGLLVGNLGDFTNQWRSEISATNAVISRQKLDATNGTAYNLTVGTNLSFSPGFRTIQFVTNVIGVSGFAQPYVDGTYILQSSGLLTNNINSTNTLLQAGGNWYLQSNGVSLFQLSGNHPIGSSWTVVNGTGTIGQSVYGWIIDENGGFHKGIFTSTNLDARIRALVSSGAVTNGDTRAITLGNTNNVFYGTFNGASTSTATNAQYLGGVYYTAYMGTNSPLYISQIRTNGALPNYVLGFDGSSVLWITNAGGGSFSGVASSLSAGLTNWVNTQASQYSLDATNGLRSDLMARIAAATNNALTLATNNDFAIGQAGTNNVIASTGRSTNMTMSASNSLYTVFKNGTNDLAAYVRAATNGIAGGSGTNQTPWNSDIDANGHKLYGASAVYGQESDNTFYIGSDDTSTFAANSSSVVLKTGNNGPPSTDFHPGSIYIYGGYRDGANLQAVGSLVLGYGPGYDYGFKGTNAFYGTNYFKDDTFGTVGTFNSLNATNVSAYSVGSSAYYLDGIPVFTSTPSGISFFATNGTGRATNFNGVFLYSGESLGWHAYTNTIHTNYYYYNSPTWNYFSTNSPIGSAAYSKLLIASGYYTASSAWPTNEMLMSVLSGNTSVVATALSPGLTNWVVGTATAATNALPVIAAGTNIIIYSLTGTNYINATGGGNGGITMANVNSSMSSGTNTFAGNGVGLTNVQWVTFTVGQSNAMFTDIQTALNYVPKNPQTNGTPRGMILNVGPGIYNSNGPAIWLTNTFLTSVIIQGAGEIATAIHASNTVFKTVGNVGNPEGARLHFYVRDLAMISDTDTTNAICEMVEYAVWDARNCLFSWNGYITNTQWGISTAPSNPNPNTHPLFVTGPHFYATDENNTWFSKCHFNGLAVGIHASAAHPFVEDCEFVQIGNYLTGTTNGYPITNPRATGASILLDSCSYEAHVMLCNFVQTRVSVALVNTIGGQFYVRDCYLENGGPLLNDDTGALLDIQGATAVPTVTLVSPANYTSFSGGLSVYSTYSGFVPDNYGLAADPFWTLSSGGVNRLQMLSDYSLRGSGNFALAAGSSFKGSGLGLTNFDLTTNLKNLTNSNVGILGANSNIWTGNNYGNGLGWTNLQSANLTGTIADARLSSNVPLLNTNNLFTSGLTLTNPGIATSLTMTNGYFSMISAAAHTGVLTWDRDGQSRLQFGSSPGAVDGTFQTSAIHEQYLACSIGLYGVSLGTLYYSTVGNGKILAMTNTASFNFDTNTPTIGAINTLRAQRGRIYVNMTGGSLVVSNVGGIQITTPSTNFMASDSFQPSSLYWVTNGTINAGSFHIVYE